MQSFLSNVIDDILKRNKSISSYTFILPSKRAGVFLKHEIKNKVDKSIILPKIISIEDFINDISLISLIDNTTLLFEFYSVYINLADKKSIDNFDKFTKWATVTLQDFNEIDRHLIDPTYIFSYLRDINKLEKWSLQKGTETQLIKNYFSFFERLEKYYIALNKHLLNKQIGYQGLQYKEAVENLHNYIENNKSNSLVFVGFNALNKAEEVIIQELLENNIASIYWDADEYYFENNQTSTFLKKYKNEWKYYQKNPFNWIQQNFNLKKNIEIIGTPKNNTQIKYVGELLSSKCNNNFQNTALVLADESLLPLTLNSLPKEIENVNITMGYDLNNMPIVDLFNSIFKLHVNSKKSDSYFYYRDIIRVLNHSSIISIVNTGFIIEGILKNNFISIDKNSLANLALQSKIDINSFLFLFENWDNIASVALKQCIKLIELLKENTNTSLEKEFLFKMYTVFQQIETLNKQFGYIKNIKTLQQFYNQLLKYEKLSFQGEPLSGLQLMGMLETRVLDFETVILTSVNEGILPAGKSDNSFIPFDVKKEVGLPTYQEKDAIYSYHFYRLIQRAKNVYLLYNTENNQYGSGEQSRFLTQLEISKPEDVTKYIISPKINSKKNESKEVLKTPLILNKLNELAQKGLSPTALITYIYNPIDFYKQKVLGVNETENIEETIAANTLGTIIHKTLESFYTPIKGRFLKKSDVIAMKRETPLEVKKWFEKEYKNGDITSGKNLLIYNVAQQFILNFLNHELLILNDDKKLKILELEYDLTVEIVVEGIKFPIRLKGQADRIDELDGVLRIIDYKTGKVDQSQLNIKDWQLITTDYKKYSKSFQVLLYAYMYSKMNGIDLNIQFIESGVISFKNLKAGFLRVNKRVINNEDLINFTNELKQLVLEIFNPNIPFKEKENTSY